MRTSYQALLPDLPGPGDRWRLRRDDGLVHECVLVDRDELRCGEDRQGLLRHFGEVVPGEQRRGKHAPHREVRQVLLEAHPVANLQHIRVVDRPGPSILRPRLVEVEVVQDGLPARADVLGDSPHVGVAPHVSAVRVNHP